MQPSLLLQSLTFGYADVKLLTAFQFNAYSIPQLHKHLTRRRKHFQRKNNSRGDTCNSPTKTIPVMRGS